MNCIPPLKVLYSNTVLTSSTIAEPDTSTGEALWNNATTYSTLNQEVVWHSRKYRNLNITGNLNKEPGLTANATFWQDIGSSNRWAMFDLKRNNSSIVPTGPIKVVLTPGSRTDSIALLGLKATSYLVEVKQGATVIYTTGTVSLTTRNTQTWYQYYYGKFGNIPSIILDDLPPQLGVTIEITLNNGSSPCGLSALIIGTSVYIGYLQYDAENDTVNFSTFTRDADGNATLIPKRNIPITNNIVDIQNSNIDTLLALRNTLAGEIAVWSGLDDAQAENRFNALLILGKYNQFKFKFDKYSKSLLTLQLEEM